MKKGESSDHIVMPEDHMEELYSSGNPLVRFVHVDRLDSIVKEVPKKKKLRVFDAGCGEGQLIKKIHKKNPKSVFFGTDITKVALSRAKKRCSYANFSKQNLTNLNFEDSFFDVVTCTEVLEHIYEYKKVIKELKRVLKKKGLLIITFPNEGLWTFSRFLLGRRPIKVPDHVNSFKPSMMIKTVGLRILSRRGIPFKLPFFCSLGYLVKFRK